MKCKKDGIEWFCFKEIIFGDVWWGDWCKMWFEVVGNGNVSIIIGEYYDFRKSKIRFDFCNFEIYGKGGELIKMDIGF